VCLYELSQGGFTWNNYVIAAGFNQWKSDVDRIQTCSWAERRNTTVRIR